ncbi:hypothetical protein ScPMuIL_014222 [Solemya velum]
MAAILKLVFDKQVTAEDVILWLCHKKEVDNLEKIEELAILRQEFISYFLNYLRNQTFHLLQSARSGQSPAKTPVSKKLNERKGVRAREQNPKRVQLFSASPAEISEELTRLSPSFLSPDHSAVSTSPELTNPKHVKSSGHYRSNRTQSFNKFTGHNHSIDTQRSKQKFSLGEFFITPEKTNSHRKHRSSHSGGKKERTDENCNSVSPLVNVGNRRRTPLPQNNRLSQSENCQDSSFSFDLPLGSTRDFPPVGSTKGTKSLDSNQNEQVKQTVPSHRRETLRSTPLQNTTKVPDECAIQGKSVKKSSKPSRRINPTPVQPGMERPRDLAFAGVLVSPNVFTTKEQTAFDTPVSHMETQRDLLGLKGKSGKVETPDDINSSNVPSPKSTILRQSSSTDILVADRLQVTFPDKLDILVDLYSGCLMENVLPNLSVEIYFLTQLLTVKRIDTELSTDEDDEENFFHSIHNAVYFSTMVMQKQARFLTVLDKSTLRLLSDNQRIAAFTPVLKAQVAEAHQSLLAKSSDLPISPIGGVSFQADTDNRQNFPNDKAFHMFKRQRDMFYELIREWEENNMTPGWSVAKMADRIQDLISYRTELANHLHFARLFQSQLLTMCKGDGSITTDGDDENIALLSQLKQSNPEKWKKLQERFIKPRSCGGPCPSPSFPGCQEFFRDFIVAASSPVFNQHLADTFAAKVTELNSGNFSSEENDITEETGNDETHDEWKELFCSNLLTLRLLGKFLGFVTFLPYQTVEKLPDSITASYILIRNRLYPSLDILKCIRAAWAVGRLTLTIPWVVEFLSLMDYVAPQLDYFQLVLLLMLHIQRVVWLEMREEMWFGRLMVVTMLSWLFENPAVPEGFFFSDIPVEVLHNKNEASQKDLLCLDDLNLVDQQIFYMCCPYIGEVRNLLVEFAVGFNSNTNTIRKITPIAADHTLSTPGNKKHIQNQLEENFFHNHPASLRRCVDFVGERTASNYIKKFRSEQLQTSIEHGKQAVNDYVQNLQGSSPTKAKDRVSQEVYKISQTTCLRTKTAVLDGIEEYCRPRTEDLLKLLLPDEQQEAVVSTAARISARIAGDRVVQWVHKHIVPSMYNSELVLEVEKLLRDLTLQKESSRGSEPSLDISTAPGTIAQTHDMNVSGPSDTLVELKELLRDLLLGQKSFHLERVCGALDMAWDTLNHRQDVLPVVLKTILQVLVDLAVAIISLKPMEFTDDLLEQFLPKWKIIVQHSKIQPFIHLLTGRVFEQIQESKESEIAWEKYTGLLIRLLKEDLLEPAALNNTCLSTLIHIKDKKILLEHLYTCLLTIQQSSRGTSVIDSELLEWIRALNTDQSIT